MTLDREKLAKIANLLTSPEPGEVVAAAGRMVSMLKSADMMPADLVLAKPAESDFSTRLSRMTLELEARTLKLRVAELEAKLARAGGDPEAEFARGYAKGEKYGREIAAAETRVELQTQIRALETELEQFRETMPWPAVAERYCHKNQRGAKAGYAKGLKMRWLTGRMTAEDQAELRKFADAEAKRAARTRKAA